MPFHCGETDSQGARADAKRVTNGIVDGTNTSALQNNSQSQTHSGQDWGLAGQYVSSPSSMPVALLVGVVLVGLVLLIVCVRKLGLGFGTRIRHD